MKEQVTFCRFYDAFECRRENFSYEGLKALFYYLEDYEESVGEEMELDVIAICCEYNEWEDLKEFQNNHSDDYKTLEDIEEHTTVIRIDNNKFITRVF